MLLSMATKDRDQLLQLEHIGPARESCSNQDIPIYYHRQTGLKSRHQLPQTFCIVQFAY